jgi:oligosaccharide repeat unit polymerase
MISIYFHYLDYFNPSVMFSAIWFFNIFVVYLFSDIFYTLSFQTLAIIICGVFCFVLGGLLMNLFAFNNLIKTIHRQPRRFKINNLGDTVLSACILFLGLYFIVYFHKLQNMYNEFSGSEVGYLSGIRAVIIDQPDILSASFSKIDFLAFSFAPIFSIIAFMEIRKNSFYSKLRAVLAILSGLAYQLSTGAKNGAFILIVALFAVVVVRKSRFGLRHLLQWIGVVVVIFVFISILRDSEASSGGEGVGKFIVDQILIYGVGGTVAFDKIITSHLPNTIMNPGIFLPLKEICNSIFGCNFVVPPSLNQEYIVIGNNAVTNVYTMYYNYYSQYGFILAMCILAMQGGLSTVIYLKAKAGSSYYTLIFGALLFHIIMSGFNENFFLSFMYMVKITIAYCLIYGWGFIENWGIVKSWGAASPTVGASR